MLALSLGLLFVMIVIAGLLADMERKRRTIVDLLDQLAPMLDRSRRLTLANLRRLSRSPVQAYSLIDPLEREIGLLEVENDIVPDEADTRRTSVFAGTRLANFQQRIQTLAAMLGTTPEAAAAPETTVDTSAEAPS